MDAIGRLVRDGTAVGTAFVVTADGLAVTAQHVIGSRADATWTFEPLAASGQSWPADVSLAADEGADVTLVQVTQAEGWQPLPLASHLQVPLGAPVHLRGFAAPWDFDSGVGEYIGETGDQGRVWVKVSCKQAQPGMSGAPVVATGTGCVIGLVSSRLNEDRWNRDTVLLARTEDVVALAPDRLRLVDPPRTHHGGTLRLSWDRGNRMELILQTDDFDVTFGRNPANDVCLPDDRDSRFHGKLGLDGPVLVYHHLGSHPAYLMSAAHQVTIAQGGSSPVADKDRLQFASGVILIEFSAPDLYDPAVGPTARAEDDPPAPAGDVPPAPAGDVPPARAEDGPGDGP
jgi:Trypsin-like peptidase domain